MTGSEQVLVEDWCQQYPSHSVGSVEFGADGRLYASGGDGASFEYVDYGQTGSPLNPCGDPPGGVGATLTPPTAEGGALRSQDLRTAGDPVTLDGTIIRVDPATGAGLPDNPLAGSSDVSWQLRCQRPADHRQRAPQPLPLHQPPWHQRAVAGRRRLGRLGGDQPHHRPAGHGGELRLALLRGGRAPRWLRRHEPQHLREPLRPTGRGHRPVLRLPPQQPGGPQRDLPDRARPAAPRSPGWTSSSPPPTATTRRTMRTRSSSPTTPATASG